MTKIWNQARCLITEEWLWRCGNLQSGYLCSCKLKKDIIQYAVTWLDLENMLCKVPKKERQTQYDLTKLWYIEYMDEEM